MAEPKPKFLRALSNALGLPQTADVSERIHPAVSTRDAAESIKASDRKSLETSVAQNRYGKRTFPTATAVGYATPMYRDAGSIMATNRKRRREAAEPFFRDEATGEVKRGGLPVWSKVPVRLPGRTNDPNAWPGNVPEPFVSEGPLDQFMGEEHMRIEGDRAAKARGQAAKQRIVAKKQNFLSDLLFKLLN